jgi:hypothetical protein
MGELFAGMGDFILLFEQQYLTLFLPFHVDMLKQGWIADRP